MARRLMPVALCVVTLYGVVVSVWPAYGAEDTGVDPSCYNAEVKMGTPCPGEESDPQAAINNPSGYSWTVFAQINQPAFPGNTKDTRRVWETWKSADDNSNPEDAIYLDNGHEPRPWSVKPKDTRAPKRLVPVQQLQFLNQQSKDPGNFTVQFIPTNPLAEEVRVNRPAFNFIKDNRLYNRQGQYQYASTHPDFDFPTASKEIKAIWLEISDGDKVADYYSADSDGKTYILVAAHVITKDLPFWHWSSFVHKDKNRDPQNDYAAPLADYQEVPASLKGTPFENYRLLAELVQSGGSALTRSGKGAQVDWVTRTGHATVMGNPHIEQGFETKSSCITCHSHSSIGLTQQGAIEYNLFPLAVGAVNPSDFVRDGVTFYPLDFVWSLRQAKNYKP